MPSGIPVAMPEERIHQTSSAGTHCQLNLNLRQVFLSSQKLPVSLNLGDGRTPFCQWLLGNDGVYVASHFSPWEKWPQTCYSTAYCTKGPFFLEKKNTVLVMTAHVILTRILEFEIFKMLFQDYLIQACHLTNEETEAQLGHMTYVKTSN